MDRREFIKGLAKSAPAIAVVGVAMVTSTLLDRKEASEVIRVEGHSGRWYEIKAEALELAKNQI